MGQEWTQAQGAAPDPASVQAPPETPQEQPEQPNAAATGAPQPPPERPTWTPEDTRASQQFAQLKRELGLPKNAGYDRVLEAINQRAAPPQPTDWDNLDPAIQERLQAQAQEIWTFAAEAHGDVVVDASRQLFEMALYERNPAKFARAFVDAVLAVTEAPGESNGEQPYDDQQQPQPLPEEFGGDVPLAPQRNPNADPTGGRANTGDMLGFVKGLFASRQG
jgi:hypothetical protein